MRGWLGLGPVAVCMEAPAVLWPWPWPLLRRPGPPRHRWRLALRCRHAPGAGAPGPLVRRGAGDFLGPGFMLRRLDDGAYAASVQGAIESMAALSAALIDTGEREPLAVAHGALLAVGDRGALVLGPSGAGKSTFAARHEARTRGANAALLWTTTSGVRACALPITGHGDASVRPGSVRLVGGLWLGESRVLSPGRALGRWVSALATAQGGRPSSALWPELMRLPLRGI